jgi:hypothetical protein
MNEQWQTILISLISSGVLVAIIEWARHHPKDKADAALVAEQAQTEDLAQQKTRQDILKEWELRYGDLVRRLDNEREIRENVQRSTAEVIMQLRHDLEVERDARLDAEKRSYGQAQLLIQQQAQLDDMTELVHGLSEENARLTRQMDSMQITIDEQVNMINSLKKKLIGRDARIVSLEHTRSVDRAEQAIRHAEDDG